MSTPAMSTPKNDLKISLATPTLATPKIADLGYPYLAPKISMSTPPWLPQILKKIRASSARVLPHLGYP